MTRIYFQTLFRSPLAGLKVKLFLLIAVLSFSCQAFAAESIFLKADCPGKAYVGQVLKYTLYLYSQKSDIQGFDCVSLPQFGGGIRADVWEAQIDNGATRVDVDGKMYYRWAIAAMFIIPNETGKLRIPSGSYKIYVPSSSDYYDPFSLSYGSLSVFDLKADDVSVKVSKLPKNAMPSEIPVGEYSVDTTVPPGKIHRNSDAVAIVRVAGYGVLPEKNFFDFSDAFSDGAKFKSMSYSVNNTQKNGRLYSELIYEIVFTPLSESGTIAPVKLRYFDPMTGKFRTAVSDSVNWQTSDSSDSFSSPKEILNI